MIEDRLKEIEAKASDSVKRFEGNDVLGGAGDCVRIVRDEVPRLIAALRLALRWLDIETASSAKDEVEKALAPEPER
jgi:hypothetical protein